MVDDPEEETWRFSIHAIEAHSGATTIRLRLHW